MQILWLKTIFMTARSADIYGIGFFTHSVTPLYRQLPESGLDLARAGDDVAYGVKAR